MRLTTDQQFEQILTLAREDQSIYFDHTHDRWGESLIIFEDWSSVEKVGQIVYSNLTILSEDSRESIPTYKQSRYPVNPYHHIEWAIGEFGFTDQWQTCSHCHTAIDTQDMHLTDYWFDGDMGDLICPDCLRTNQDFQGDFLNYCAKHLGDSERQTFHTSAVHPGDHGFICLNNYSTQYDPDLPMVDCPNWRGHLDTANDKDFTNLARAVRTIDPNIQIVTTWGRYSGGVYVFWARFENTPDLPSLGNDAPTDSTQALILEYAIGIVLQKWATITWGNAK